MTTINRPFSSTNYDDSGDFEAFDTNDADAIMLPPPTIDEPSTQPDWLTPPAFRPDEAYLRAFSQHQAAQVIANSKNGNGNPNYKSNAAKLGTGASTPPVVKQNGTNGSGSFGKSSFTDFSAPHHHGNGSNGEKSYSAPRSRNSSKSKGAGRVHSENFSGKNFFPLAFQGVPELHYELVKTPSELQAAIEYLRPEPIIAVDTETTGLDRFVSEVLLVQIATPQKVFVIDAKGLGKAMLPLREILENPRSLKILQNAKFDYQMIKQNTGIELENIFDTYLAERLLTAGLGLKAGLDVIVQRHLNVTMDKTIRKHISENNYLSDAVVSYGARDAQLLIPIYAKQLEKLTTEDLLEVAELEFRCVTAVGDLELAGCRLDTVKWRGLLVEEVRLRDTARAELLEMLPGGTNRQGSMFGSDEYLINLNSSHQIMDTFRQIGIELTDTAEPSLKRINHPAVKKLLDYRGHEKTLGSFGESLLGLIHPKTNRIHPEFHQYGADTGRFSCSNPNVQQIPGTSDFRSCFIPEEGYKLITSDYSQAELRILAELSGDEKFKEAFEKDIDLHKLAASQMFDVAIENVTKDQRGQAKAINFGLAYGMGGQGLANRIDKTVDESNELINAYFKAFSGVKEWLEQTGKDSLNNGYSPTPLGRKRYYNMPQQTDPEYRKKISDIVRQGKNAPIQGCNADMTKIALVFLREKLKNYDARVVNTVHDEIVVEVREHQAEEVCLLVEHEMIRAGQEMLKAIPIKADAKVGDYWSK